MADERWVFVLRIWLEPDGEGPPDRPRMRGSVQRVDGAERRQFTSLDQLAACVRDLAGFAGEPDEAARPRPPTCGPEGQSSA